MVSLQRQIVYFGGDYMCLAIPGRIISIEGDAAVTDMLGFESEVYIGLVGKVSVGDYVLIHAGCAIEIIDCNAFDYLNDVCKNMLKEVSHEE